MIFDIGFDKTIELIKEVDVNLYNFFRDFCLNLPANVKSKTEECEDFSFDNDLYNAEMLRTVNSLNLDFITYKEYFRNFVYVRRFFEEDILEENVDLSLFVFNQRNTKRKLPNLNLYYEKNDNGYKFLGTNDKDCLKNTDTNYEVKLQSRDEMYYLVSTKSFRGIEIYRKEVPIGLWNMLKIVKNMRKSLNVI